MLMDNKIPATEDLHVYRKKQQWSRGPIIVRSKLTFRRMKNISHNRASLCFDGKAKTSCVNIKYVVYFCKILKQRPHTESLFQTFGLSN